MKERRKIIALFSLFVILVLLFGFPTYFLIINNSEDIKHETNRWAIIEDIDGNQLAVDMSNSSIWEQIRKVYETNLSSHIFIYGIVVSYDNSWQFRLEPSTVFACKTNYIRMPPRTIIEIRNNLEWHLSMMTVIRIESIRFFNCKYAGMIALVIDLIVSIVSIITFSLYLMFTNKMQKQYEKTKGVLLIAKETQGEISFAQLSQKVNLKQKRLEGLIEKKKLKEDLGLQITDEYIQFKDLIYSKSISQIEEQLNNFFRLPHNQLTLEHYSKLFQFKTELNEALMYFKDSSNMEKQRQIESKIEVIANLLDSITLDDFK